MPGQAVTIVDSGGYPVRAVDSGAPVLKAVESGGMAITLSAKGAPFTVVLLVVRDPSDPVFSSMIFAMDSTLYTMDNV